MNEGGTPQNLKPFKKKESGNPNGRPKRLVSSVCEELEKSGNKPVAANEVRDCYMRLLNIPIEELNALVSDNKNPALIRIIGKAILSAKGFEIIEKMLDRSFGKALQTVDLNANVTVEPTLTQEQLNVLIDSLK